MADILPNTSVVTGAATELGLLCRETDNQRVWASVITDHEQRQGHREWGTKLIIASNASALVREHEMMTDRLVPWTVEG